MTKGTAKPKTVKVKYVGTHSEVRCLNQTFKIGEEKGVPPDVAERLVKTGHFELSKGGK